MTFKPMNCVSQAPADDLLWRQYALHVDLYKFYLDLTIKVNVFYYATTGAILSYYFQHTGDGAARYALILPVVFSVALGGIFWCGSNLVSVVRREMFTIRDQLHLTAAPEFQVLTVFLRVMGTIVLVVGAVLVWYFYARA